MSLLSLPQAHPVQCIFLLLSLEITNHLQHLRTPCRGQFEVTLGKVTTTDHMNYKQSAFAVCLCIFIWYTILNKSTSCLLPVNDVNDRMPPTTWEGHSLSAKMWNNKPAGVSSLPIMLNSSIFHSVLSA